MKKKEFTKYKTCRICNSPTIKAIDLGRMPLAGGFLKNKSYFKTEKKYPLELTFCKKCYLLQTSIAIRSDILFKNYFYFSSYIRSLVNHFEENAELFSNLLVSKNKFVVEIGSNDGTFLNAMHKKDFTVLGVDPATNVVRKMANKTLPVVNDYFDETVAAKIIKKNGYADLIFSSNTLAHIENIQSVFKGIENLLAKNGILVFEVHYMPELLKTSQYDMIYHEHQYYYSLLTLKKFLKSVGLNIYDARKIDIHGGSIQVFAKKEKTSPSKRLVKLIDKEKKQKINNINTYFSFDKKIKESRTELLNLIKEIKKEKKSIAGYGASGRGAIVLNYCKIENDLINQIIDDAPAKIGAFMPGTHQEIISSKILSSKNKPDYILLFAWAFFNEISKKNKKFISEGGKFIYPLPKVKFLKS